MTRGVSQFALFLALLAPLSASAKLKANAPSLRFKLSASARLALHFWQSNRSLPEPGREPVMDAREARVALRFVESPSDARLEELAASGINFWHHNGSIVRRGRLVPARVPFEMLEVVEFWPDIERIELRLRPPRPDVVENTPEMIERPPVWAAYDDGGIPIMGKGITVGVVDGWVDLFHPWFFRPDGPQFEWFDGNGNGQFDPGVDGIDGDGDGQIGAGEIVGLIKGTLEWNDGSQIQFANAKPGYYPPLDWLWLDINDSGQREFGPGPGFTDSAPAFGEPVFVADDVDGDGKLDLGEKLVGLRTSKLKSIHFVANDTTFERGKNLITYPVPLEGGSHATMTLGVLAGGAAPYQPFAGVAPEAEIVLADMDQGTFSGFGGEMGSAYLAASIILAEAGADVLMHEYGWPLMEFGDGSSVLEEGLDEIAKTEGVLSCTAAHNFAGYDMHAVATVPASDSIHFPIATNILGETYPTELLYLTLRYIGTEDNVSLTLKNGDAIEVSFGQDGGGWEGSEVAIWYSGHEVSSRKTHMMSLAVYPNSIDSNMLPGEGWLLSVTNNGTEDLVVDLFAADQTGYLYSATITEFTTEAGTMAHPGTADSVVTVGAYRANIESWYTKVEVGDLNAYSGQGPRIDGERGLDIVGPSDMVASAWSPDMSSHPGFRYASGTSGSLPQVTGAVALLLQAEPDLAAAEVKQRIIDGAIQDEFTGTEINPIWGAGKLSAYRTLFGEEPPDNLPPKAMVIGPSEVRLQESFLLDATYSVDDGPVDELEVRWDLNYDGAFDIPYKKELTLSIDAIYEPGPFVALAEIRDGYGYTDRALVRVVVLDELYQPPPPEPELDGDVPGQDLVANPDDVRTIITRHGGCSTSQDSSPKWLGLALLALVLGVIRTRRNDCNCTPSMPE